MLSDVEHLDTAALEDGLAAIRRAPRDAGTVELIVRRPTPEEREVVPEAELDPATGLVGDCWLERGSRATEDGSAHPEMQLTMMSARAAALIARTYERWPLAGDQLYVDLDLSAVEPAAGHWCSKWGPRRSRSPTSRTRAAVSSCGGSESMRCASSTRRLGGN